MECRCKDANGGPEETAAVVAAEMECMASDYEAFEPTVAVDHCIEGHQDDEGMRHSARLLCDMSELLAVLLVAARCQA